MTRAAVVLLGLTAWLAGGLGARAYWGARAYLTHILGDASLAEQMLSRALAEPEAQVAGLGPWALLLSCCVVVSAALVLVVLAPVDAGMRRAGVMRSVRVVVGAGLGAAATAAVLLSIHPLLSRPTVPEGPRTVLNYACEAAGYGWVNAIAYLGAIVAGIVLAAWPARPAPADTGGAAEASVTDSSVAADSGSRGAEASAPAGAPSP